MNVLMITRRTHPKIGGVETHVKEVNKILRRKDISIRLITENQINSPQIPIFGLFYIWLWFLRNRRLAEQADLVHVHDVFIWYLPIRLLFWAKPVYATFHGWEGRFPIPARYKWIRQISAKLAWGNICVGRYIEKWYGIQADFVTYGGVAKIHKQSLTAYKQSLTLAIARTKQSLTRADARTNSKIKIQNDNSKIKILFIGRLEEDTGLPVYLKALRLIKEGYPEMEVEFLGDGPMREECEKQGKVRGFVADVLPHIRKARFIFSSGYLSMLEAMACGKLVFAVYDNPVKKDYLKMSPFKNYAVIEKDPFRLAQSVAYFREHLREEKERAEAGARWTRQLSWGKVARLYLKLWRFR